MNYKKIFFSLYIFSFLISIPVHAEDIRIKWIELVPKYAYSFVPETGVTEEMWEDESFLKKIEDAGLASNRDLVGKKINELVKEGKITKKRLDEIVDRTKKGGAEIVKYLEKGSAFYAPAASGVEMAESYLKDLKKQLPCAAFLNGEYGFNNIYAGVPVIIGREGVEKIVEINLSEQEKNSFKESVISVKELFNAAIKIDSDLSDK